ncbi:VOC family protein [Gottfriedia acidiceleris]|uniref:VOC family protein n=1 Tax=Gottfriedia acidiceleris TaxID=371036 RepID=UPI00101C8A34|nr:VOC family protein [Gottfriedia acidiceleris]
MGKVIKFEVQVPNIEQAIDFYSKSFEWKFTKMPGQHNYYFIQTRESTDKGIDGGLMLSPDGQTCTTNSIDVASIDKAMEQVINNGGQIVVPKTAIPQMGYFAYFIDNQGLLFGLSEENTNA